jgi:hypothetical protein
MGVDLERDGRVGVADPITKDLGSMPESSDSVEYVCLTSWSRIRREPAASTRRLNGKGLVGAPVPVVTRMASAASCSRILSQRRCWVMPNKATAGFRTTALRRGGLVSRSRFYRCYFYRVASWAELTIWSMTLAGGAPARSDTVTKISDVGTMPEAAGPVSTATVSAWNLAFAVEKAKRTW